MTKYQVVEQSVVGEGGFLTLRRMKLNVVGRDGRVHEGLYDFVERPMGRDAVVVMLWHLRLDGEVGVLLRNGLRVPVTFGRPDGSADKPTVVRELVAGILEGPSDSDSAIRDRAASEALEEAGIKVDATLFEPLGPAVFPSPGMCAEKYHFRAIEVTAAQVASLRQPEGDGSPFEVGATIEWVPLDDALMWCRRGDICDLKTEVGLRRLQEWLNGPKSPLKKRR